MRETVLFEKAIPKFEKVIPNIDGIPVKINKSYADLVKKKGYVLSDLHIHTDIELLYIHEGKLGTKLADGTVYYCSDGDIICINSNVGFFMLQAVLFFHFPWLLLLTQLAQL